MPRRKAIFVPPGASLSDWDGQPVDWARSLSGAEFERRKAELEARDGTAWRRLTKAEKAAKAARRPIINRF